MGDFNAIMDIEDRVGGALVRMWHSWHEDLYASLQEGEARVFLRIAMVLSNSAWEAASPNSEVEYLEEGDFDHCPIILS